MKFISKDGREVIEWVRDKLDGDAVWRGFVDGRLVDKDYNGLSRKESIKNARKSDRWRIVYPFEKYRNAIK